MSSDDWKRLGARIVRRRIDVGLRTTKAFAEKAGLTPRMLGDIENGRRANYSAGTIAQIESALYWEPGSITRILEGKEPTESRRQIAVHMSGSSPHEEIVRAISDSFSRAHEDFDAEVDAQDTLVGGVREAWKLAPIAARLGCNAAEIRDFTHAGFGLLLGSGALGILANNQQTLGEIVSEFAEADRWGARPPRSAPASNNSSKENSYGVETTSKSDAQTEGDEGEEGDVGAGGARPSPHKPKPGPLAGLEGAFGPREIKDGDDGAEDAG